MKVKIKKRDVPKNKQWTNCYRVFRDNVPVGWQWKKPANYRAVPYADTGTDTQRIFWPEGEKDTDTLNKLRLFCLHLWRWRRTCRTTSTSTSNVYSRTSAS